MRHSNRPRRGRGRGALSDDALFERALRGESPSDDSGGQGKFNPREHRKTLQLCRQVQRALSMALAGECGDDLLRDAYVESVEPAGGAGHLRVTVVTTAHGAASQSDVAAALGARAPRLRAAVARQICRKRVPTLSFVVVPSPASHLGEDGGAHGN